MTNDTFKTFKLILYKSFFSNRNGLMAACTSCFGVFPVELKPRFVVVKFFDFPTFRRRVAFGAIRYSFYLKLRFVHIFMARGAIGM